MEIIPYHSRLEKLLRQFEEVKLTTSDVKLGVLA